MVSLFSGEDIVTVGASVTRLIDEIPNTERDAVTRALLQGTPIVDALLSANTSGMLSNGQNFLNYGRDTFVHGLPTGAQRIYQAAGVYDTASYLPIVPIRTFKQNTNHVLKPDGGYRAGASAQDITLYEQSKRLLGIVGGDLDTITDAIQQNPDIGKIEDAFVSFTVDMATESSAGLAYLFAFWEEMSNQIAYGNIIFAWSEYINENDGLAAVQRIDVESGAYDLRFAFNYAWGTVKNGSIGPVGHCEKEVKLDQVIERFPDVSGRKYRFHIYYIRKQITSNTYKEIEVVGPQTGHGVRERYAARSELDSPNGMSFPLDFTLLHTLSGADQSDLLMEALSLTIYTYEEQHLKWYETTAFAELIEFIGIVITLYTLGQARGWVELAKAILLNLVLGAVAVELVKLIGIENAFIIAAVTLAAAAVSGYNGTEGLLSADKLMMATNSVSEGISVKLAEEVSAFQEELKLAAELAESRAELIERAEEHLTHNQYLSPLDYVSPSPLFLSNEDPEAFYARTLQANPGIVALNSISTFVDRSLQLPKFDDNAEMIRIAGQTTIG